MNTGSENASASFKTKQMFVERSGFQYAGTQVESPRLGAAAKFLAGTQTAKEHGLPSCPGSGVANERQTE
jgi:hypothetical protein